jgi:hypothetical protein
MPKATTKGHEESQADATEVVSETTTNENEVTNAPAPAEAKVKEVAAAVTSQVKTRKVLGLQNHQCTIGGSRIIIEKNMEIDLSVDAATILSRAGKVLIK